MGDATRIMVVVRDEPPARVLVNLHRILGLGLSEVRNRLRTGRPIVDVEMFGNDHDDVAKTLMAVLVELQDTDYTIHECVDTGTPSPRNRITPEVLRNILGRDALATPRARPNPDSALTTAIATSARGAITQLHSDEPGPFCLYALLTSGEALRPYLSVTLDGPNRWDLADSPFAVFGDEHFAPLEKIYAERGSLFEMTPTDADTEYWVRLMSMEAALRTLDEEGLFGTGRDREQTLLLVTPMPPDHTDAESARRLNPRSALLVDWLKEASEGYVAG